MSKHPRCEVIDIIETLTAYEFIIAQREIASLPNQHYQDADAAFRKMMGW
jgi:hypothetical protein